MSRESDRKLLLEWDNWLRAHDGYLIGVPVQQRIDSFLDSLAPAPPEYRIPALPVDPEADALVSRYVASRMAPHDVEHFIRGDDPENETCKGCGKHISRHYGGTKYRCHPLPEPSDEDQRLDADIERLTAEIKQSLRAMTKRTKDAVAKMEALRKRWHQDIEDEILGPTEAWRKWHRENCSEWDKVADIERELGRGDDGDPPVSPDMEQASCPFCGGTSVERRDGESAVVPVIWWCRDCDRKVLPVPMPLATELPPELEGVLRDPKVRLVGEVSALLRAREWVNHRLREAGYDPMSCIYPEDVPKAAVSASPSTKGCPDCGRIEPHVCGTGDDQRVWGQWPNCTAHEMFGSDEPQVTEQRYWRVFGNVDGSSAEAWQVNEKGEMLLPRKTPERFGPQARKQAEEDARSWGIPEWPGRKP